LTMETQMTEVLREQPSDGVALLRINRPERLNALSMSVRDTLAVHFREITADPSIRCVVVTGDEKAFAAGADVVELAKRTPIDEAFARSRVAWTAIESCPKPIIAAINGFALGGGCELAMHCDIIIAGESAKLGQPEVKLGIMPGAGGTQRFLRAVGKFAAMRWLLTGDILSAAEAKTMGLVSEVVADAEVMPHALALAAKLAALPPLAVMAIKESVINGADAPLAAGLLLERKAFQLLFASKDRDEGISAFLERRKPQFRGQ
jgi:enoyl-CoA hydratase